MQRQNAASIIIALFSCLFFVSPAVGSSLCQPSDRYACPGWWQDRPLERKAAPAKARKAKATIRNVRKVVAKHDAAPRSCLAAPAAALLAGLEAECGRKRIVKTCCTGCRMTLTPSRASLHSKRLAFDTEETSAAAKACTVAYLGRQKKGTVITYGWLPKVVHADVGSFVKRVHAGKADSDAASWPIAQVEKKSPVRDISPEPVKNDGKIELASADPSAMLDERPAKVTAPPFLPKIDAETRKLFSLTGEPIDPKPSGPLHGPVAEIGAAAKAYGQPKNVLWAIGSIESSLGCRKQTGRYKGLFQLSQYLFDRYGSGDIFNCRDNAYAAAKKFAVEARMYEEVVGEPPTDAKKYMFHQQGWQGAAMHAAYPDRLAWRNMHDTDEGQTKTRFGRLKGPAAGIAWAKAAIWKNLDPKWQREFKNVENVTSRMFTDAWEVRVNKLSARYASKPPREITVAAKSPTKKAKSKKRHDRRVRYAAR